MSKPASRQNPFPGMNPFMESAWWDVHVVLLGEIRGSLSSELPDDLMARAEERIEMVEIDEEGNQGRRSYRGDVVISERWKSGLPSVWQPEENGAGSLAVLDPEFVPIEQAEDRQRWVEIRQADGTIVTVIEVLSLVNKTAKRREYSERRQRFMEGGANVVEIDLLRGGKLTAMADTMPASNPNKGQKPYVVSVFRHSQPERCEVYRCGLRDRLPCFRVPLRETDLDVPLDLQPLIDRIYTTGRYWLHDYCKPLDPPLSGDDDQWACKLLSAAGLTR